MDELQLNLNFSEEQHAKAAPHLDWRERKRQARNRAAQRGARGRGNQQRATTAAARPVAAGQAAATRDAVAAAKPAAATSSRAVEPAVQQPYQHHSLKQAQQQQHGKQQPGQRPGQGAAAGSGLPRKRQAVDSLHGYGGVLAAAATQATDNPPKRQRQNPAQLEAAAAQVDEAGMSAAEQQDVMELVRMNMQVEQHIQQEMQQQQRRHKPGRSSDASSDDYDDEDAVAGMIVPKALRGVVEFGDAPDELDPVQLAQQQQQQQQQWRQGQGQHKQHDKKKGGGDASSQQQQQQQLVQHKVGEMAHAEPNVPATARAQLFGDVAAAGAGGSSWSCLGLSEQLLEHLVALNFQEPTQVQQRTIPVLLAGRDALVRSPTGSGKTLAYLAPIIQHLQAHQPRITRADGSLAVILVPTRELAVQVNDVLTAVIRRFCWLVPGMLIGGEHRGHEKARLRKGVTVLVATPGRLLDHLQNTSSFKTDGLRWLVLDEADRLLDLGFEQKLAAITAALDSKQAAAADNSYTGDPTRQRQTVLLSATLHPGLQVLAQLSMREPVAVGFTAQLVGGKLELLGPGADDGAGSDSLDPGTQLNGSSKTSEQQQPAPVQFDLPQQLQQRYLEVPAKMRLVALAGVLRSRLRRSKAAKLVVFFSTCAGVDFHHQLLQQQLLQGDGASAAPGGPLLGSSVPVLKLHGDMKQPERTSSLVTFAKASCCVLCCTDVAARGLDFPGVSSILQYDPAGEPAEYVHRVGRTARMGQQGEALLFLLPSELPYLQLLQQHGVQLTQEKAAVAMQCLPQLVDGAGPAAAEVHRLAKKLRSAASADGAAVRGSWEVSSKDISLRPELIAAGQLMQQQLVHLVSSDTDLTRLALSAFRAFVRSYTTYPAALKHVFHIKSLHLGHLAASFGLREAPGKIGASGSAAERKKRKVEGQKAALKKEKAAWHKKAKAAVADS